MGAYTFHVEHINFKLVDARCSTFFFMELAVTDKGRDGLDGFCFDFAESVPFYLPYVNLKVEENIC